MINNRRVIRYWLVNGIWFIWFYAIGAFITYMFYQSMAQVYSLMIIAVPFILFLLLGKLFRHPLIFILTHLIIISLFFFVFSHSPARGLRLVVGSINVNILLAVYIVLMFAFLIFSFLSRFSTKPPSCNTGGTIVFFYSSLIAACLLGEFSGFAAASRFIAIIAILLFALIILYMHMLSLDNSMEIVGKNVVQPISAIFSFNNRLIAGFVFFVLFAGFAAFIFRLDLGVESFLSLFFAGILRFLRFLFAGGDTEEPASEELTMPTNQMDVGVLPDGMLVDGEPSMFWLILEAILMPALWLAMIAGIIAGVLYILYRFIIFLSNKNLQDGSGDISENLISEFVESIKFGFWHGHGHGYGPDNKVRRQFYNKVRKNMKRKSFANKIIPGDTSWDMAKKIKQQDNIDALCGEYQEARYGKGG